MSVKPNANQNFKIITNEGSIVLDVKFNSIQIMSAFHDIFDKEGNNIIESHECNSATGNTNLKLINPPDSYAGTTVSTLFLITDDSGAGNDYQIEMNVYQESNANRKTSFIIQGKTEAGDKKEGISVKFTN